MPKTLGPAFPPFIELRALPEGSDRTCELTFDGYRALLMKDDERVRILWRNETDLTPVRIPCAHRPTGSLWARH
jgi:ATP-dependent DNA ligase